LQRRLLTVALLVLLLAGAAHGHTGEGVQGGLISGFTHPLFGWDHVVAMVAVGLWGAFLGRPAIWLLPVVFPLVMAFGGALGVVGVPLPAVEAGIALSGVILKPKPCQVHTFVYSGLFGGVEATAASTSSAFRAKSALPVRRSAPRRPHRLALSYLT
jgi:hypothetical protein